MTQATTLPEGFESLRPYLDWALPTERERFVRRNTSEMTQIQEFWDAMTPLLPAALEYLDQFPEDELSGDGYALFLLALATMEIAPAVENFGEPGVPDAADFRRWHPSQ
jgi:hypothetical protein